MDNNPFSKFIYVPGAVGKEAAPLTPGSWTECKGSRRCEKGGGCHLPPEAGKKRKLKAEEEIPIPQEDLRREIFRKDTSDVVNIQRAFFKREKGRVEAQSLGLCAFERRRIAEKWWSFADPLHDDDNGYGKAKSYEHGRFQVFCAVLLSSRALPRVVREAMVKLKEFCEKKGGILSADTLSRENPDEISQACLSSVCNVKVHFGKAKARHLIQSAKAIKSSLDGRVPSEAPGLRKLPGIGPELAGCLEVAFSHGHPLCLPDCPLLADSKRGSTPYLDKE